MVVERPNDLLTFYSANCIDLMSFGFFLLCVLIFYRKLNILTRLEEEIESA